ncbi:MAG: hypothetical protein AAF764_10650 [Pseudomonadota bacterium]
MTMTQCRDAIRGNSNSTGSRVLELLSEHGLDASMDDLESAASGRRISVKQHDPNHYASGKKYPY